jgi:hypothetical protein
MQVIFWNNPHYKMHNSVTVAITTKNRNMIVGSVEYLSLFGSAVPNN